MATFYGNFERSLDAKGRLILPAKLRAEFGESAFLTSHVDGCLALFDKADMEDQKAAMLERSKGSQEDRMIARVWSASTSEVTFDAQGRIPIPVPSRTLGGTGGRRAGDRSDRQGRAVVPGEVLREGRVRQHADARGHEHLRYRAITRSSLTDREAETRDPERQILAHAQSLDRCGGSTLLRPLPTGSPGLSP